MDNVQSIVDDIAEQASATLDRRDIAELRQLVSDIEVEGIDGRETLVQRLAVAVDLEKGELQTEYEAHVIEQGGYVVERDGVSYGFDEDGNPI